MLTSFIRSSVGDHQLAEDIWQETMLTAWRRMEDFDRSRPFGPWLRGIASNTILAKQRTAARMTLVGDTDSLEYLSQRFEQLQSLAGDTLDEKLEALRDCVSHLPEEERQCIQLRYAQDLGPTELSQQLQIALETVKKRLQRSKQRLLECLNRKLQLQRG